jgi:hypothetical protein
MFAEIVDKPLEFFKLNAMMLVFAIIDIKISVIIIIKIIQEKELINFSLPNNGLAVITKQLNKISNKDNAINNTNNNIEN